MVQGEIFGEAMGAEASSDNVDEVAIQRSVNNGKDDFLATIPDIVQVDPFLADL